MADHEKPLTRDEMLEELAAMGLVRHNGEFRDGEPVYVVTEFGDQVTPNVFEAGQKSWQ
jgi:hypothetical protein